MSAMGYDATTIGNHEFDNGLAGIEKMLRHAEFPYLIANYDFDKTILKGKFLPYKVFKKGGVKIGVFGLGISLDGLVLPNQYDQTKYRDPLPIAKQIVAELRNNLGCHYIICLSHLGYTYPDDRVSDKILAKSVPDINLILGGHTHTFLEQPDIVLHSNGRETTINQVGWAGIWLGKIIVDLGPKMNPKTTVMAPNFVSNKFQG
jgi:5'-nucleotidase